MAMSIILSAQYVTVDTVALPGVRVPNLTILKMGTKSKNRKNSERLTSMYLVSTDNDPCDVVLLFVAKAIKDWGSCLFVRKWYWSGPSPHSWISI